MALSVKNLLANAGDAGGAGSSLGLRRSLGGGVATTPEFSPGTFHGQRSLAGYHSRSCKELDTTERTHNTIPLKK